MKRCIKKIYCPKCQRLVKCQEQESNGHSRIICPSCGQALYNWTGISWQKLYRPS